MSFVHLHTHSHYSLLDGLGKIDNLVSKALEYQVPALAITDHGVMYGAIEFYQKMTVAGLKPIIGVEAYLAPHGHLQKRPKIDEKPYHLVLLAKNNQGYKNLLKLTSIAHLQGYYYKPRIDWELLQQYHEGLIALTACFQGEVPRNIINNKKDEAVKIIKKYQQLFGKNNYYLELQDHPSLTETAKLNTTLLELAAELNVPVVATNDIHYIDSDDDLAHDILICLQTKHKLNDVSRMSYMGEDYSFRSPKQMQASFAHVPEAITNSLKIAEQCELKIDFSKTYLPHFKLPKGKTGDQYLRELAKQGIKQRYGKQKLTPEFKKRFDYELETIARMGFASYFLIVQDFINWAKDNGIVVGPGRGSAAGSLVSYLTGITNIDPLHYNLLFERFLNPDRISMPDIDTDFSDTRRDEVIQYVSDKYGHDNVSQIITFGTLAARVAIRDVGRVMGYSYGYCDRIAKLIPMFRTLDQALNEVPELKNIYDTDAEAKKLIETAKHIEGVARHTSTHACGVLITENELTQYVPLQYTSSSDKTIVSQYSLHPIEDLGLLKMDFLGLKNLTLIETTVEIVEKTVADKIDIDKIPLDDKKTFKLFQRGDTTGVFQFESSGMRRYLKQLKPNELEDIIAMVSLYRPGPMELIPDYIAAKNGLRKPIYLHAGLEPILEKTYGIIIYQEQIMEIARKLAGLTYAEADVLRKAVGKKIKSLLDKQKEKFVSGLIAGNMDKNIATKIWEFILPFARYGFNRSHAACYALIAYQTAYLKANYPRQFMAALLTSDLRNSDKIAAEVVECEKMGITVLPPDINESYRIFTVVMDDDFKITPRIRFGLEAIKNVGHNIASVIIHERKNNGPYQNLEDFLLRVTDKDLNKKSMESLIKVGVFDRFGERQSLLSNLDRILNFSKRNNGDANQSNLFSDTPLMSSPKLRLEGSEVVTKHEKLAWEKEFLGIYISDHPINDFAANLPNDFLSCNQVVASQNNQTVKTAGMLTAIKRIITGSGKPMIFATLEDQTGTIELIVFNDMLEKNLGIWEENKPIKVKGRISDKDGVNKIICEQVELLTLESPADSKQENYQSLTIHLPAQLKKSQVDSIKKLLGQYPGSLPVRIKIKDRDKTTNSSYKINPDKKLLKTLAEIVSAENISLDK